MTLCEENCDLDNYNYETKIVKCSCDIKINIPLFDEIRFDKDKLLKNFIDIKNVINIKVLKCFREVFNDSLKNNYGFFILIFIVVLFIICVIIFYAKSYNNIIKDISEIVRTLKTKKIYVGKKVISKKKRTKIILKRIS